MSPSLSRSRCWVRSLQKSLLTFAFLVGFQEHSKDFEKNPFHPAPWSKITAQTWLHFQHPSERRKRSPTSNEVLLEAGRKGVKTDPCKVGCFKLLKDMNHFQQIPSGRKKPSPNLTLQRWWLSKEKTLHNLIKFDNSYWAPPKVWNECFKNETSRMSVVVFGCCTCNFSGSMNQWNCSCPYRTMLRRICLQIRQKSSAVAAVHAAVAPFDGATCTAAAVLNNGKQISVGFGDGSAFELHGRWLRDACRDAMVVSPEAGERYLDRIAFSEKGQHSKGEVAEAKVVDDGVEVRWKDDPQIGEGPSYFSSGFLRMYAPTAGKVLQGGKHHPRNVDFQWLRGYSGFANAPAPDLSIKKLWKNQGVADQIQHRDYHAARNSDSANLELMQAVMEHGVVILDNVPPSQDSSVLLDFVNNCLGGMQKDPARDEPNWVIQRKAAAVSVSYAQERRLNNHTDQSVPAHGIPALLLVVNYIQGTGYNTLVDGYAVAEALRERNPAAFQLLATYGNCQERDFVKSRVDSAQSGTQSMLLATRSPIIQTDKHGNIIRVQYNEVFRTPSTVPYEKFEEWYDAYLLWNDMIHGTEFEVELPISQGQMLILDNWRVLHGRACGKSSPNRVIMGGTVVREAFHSKAIQLMGGFYPPEESEWAECRSTGACESSTVKTPWALLVRGHFNLCSGSKTCCCICCIFVPDALQKKTPWAWEQKDSSWRCAALLNEWSICPSHIHGSWAMSQNIGDFVLFLFVEFYEQAVNMGSQQGSWSIPEDQSLGWIATRMAPQKVGQSEKVLVFQGFPS